VAAGENGARLPKQPRSPIVHAISECEKRSTGEIRVHVARYWFEKDPFGRASRLFEQFGMRRTRQRNAVLIYVNLRARKFAIAADEGIHAAVGQKYWDALARNLREDLLSTHFESAIAMAVWTVGLSLRKHFPAGL
jgi:uncharacterized membrane protein